MSFNYFQLVFTSVVIPHSLSLILCVNVMFLYAQVFCLYVRLYINFCYHLINKIKNAKKLVIVMNIYAAQQMMASKECIDVYN